MTTGQIPLLRGRADRLVATLLAIVAGVAFAAAVVVVTASVRASAEQAISARSKASDVVVTAGRGDDLATAVGAIGRLPGVASVTPVREAYVDLEIGTAPRLARLSSLASDPLLRTETLVSGRWPDAPGQVVVDVSTATDSGIRPGIQLVLTPQGHPDLTVDAVGTVTRPAALGGSLPGVLAADADVAVWTGAPVQAAYVVAGPSTSQGALRDAVATVAGRATVRTGDQQAARDLASFTGGSDVVSGGLWAAAVVALAVTGMVIANTFQVVVAQRAREFALLRCVGASRRQVFRLVQTEAFAVGAAGSVVGAAVGAAGGGAITAVLGGSAGALPLTVVAVPWPGIVAASAVGIVTTLVAAARPATAATRQRPLDALREVEPTPPTARTNRLRVGVAAVLGALGGAALVAAVVSGSAPIAVVGIVMTTAAAVIATRPITSAAVRLLRGPSARLGAPATLARANLAANPQRAGSAAAALLVGVTLVATVLVGIASTRASLTGEIESRYPVDAEVLALRDPLPDGLAAGLSDIHGVSAVAAVPGTTVRIGTTSRSVLGVVATTRPVTRPGLATPADGEVLLPPAVARNSDLAEGQRVAVQGTGATLGMRVRLSDADLGAPLVSAADLLRLDTAPTTRAVWLRVAPEADATRVVEDVRAAAASTGTATVLNGAVRLRTTYESALSTAGLVALGLLAMSVLIAVLGVANTLTLSVLERTRESGLLRALGLSRAGLRACLAWEAALLATVSAVTGIALGSALGVAATYALLEFGPRTVPDVPVGQLLAVAVVSVGMAALASVVPARAALRVTPSQALATA